MHTHTIQVPAKLQTKMDYLIARLHANKGNRGVIVAELIKAFNSRPARRASDVRIQGWKYVEV